MMDKLVAVQPAQETQVTQTATILSIIVSQYNPGYCNLLSTLWRYLCLYFRGLIFITSLQDLSLRDNPLVMRFIRDMELQPATLLELSARVVKLHKLQYSVDALPGSLSRYLNTAHQCLNPDCDGVYFDHRQGQNR